MAEVGSANKAISCLVIKMAALHRTLTDYITRSWPLVYTLKHYMSLNVITYFIYLFIYL